MQWKCVTPSLTGRGGGNRQGNMTQTVRGKYKLTLTSPDVRRAACRQFKFTGSGGSHDDELGNKQKGLVVGGATENGDRYC